MAGREHFAALKADPSGGLPWAFFENAGGSYMPEQAVEASAHYQRESFVQLGAGYAASNAADATVASARKLASALATPSPNDGFVVLGGNTSTLCLMLSYAVESGIEAGDVFILASSGHEANIGPWVRVAQRKCATVLWWHPSGAHGEDACPLEGLKERLVSANGRAKLVALAHVSNLLGGVADVAAISKLAHESGAVVVCDSVAYAPHRALDAPALGADFIVWSFYKTFGPHMAGLYGTHGAWAALTAKGAVPPNHFFVTDSGGAVVGGAAPYAPWEPGGPSHEACAALVGTRSFLASVAGEGAIASRGGGDRATVEAAFEVLSEAEQPVANRLLAYLSLQHGAGRLRLIGPREGGGERVPTFSFVPTRDGVTPASVVAACHAARIACRCGHMYAYRLCQQLGVDTDKGGVVRISAIGVNTLEEAERVVAALDAAL